MRTETCSSTMTLFLSLVLTCFLFFLGEFRNEALRRKNTAHWNHWQFTTLALPRCWYLSKPLPKVVQCLDITINSSSLLITQGDFLKQFEQTLSCLKPQSTI